MARKMAEARRRGLKVVVVDPIGTNAAAKADEWVPIRPGTDGALILSMINVLINEINCYDRDFLCSKTNASYLVMADGSYQKEEAGERPLVWDQKSGGAVPFDEQGIQPALEGSFTVNGEPCRPAFELLREQVKNYSPEKASTITTIPADTIRRMAREFGEAARIGSTIMIEGQALPYRPVAVNIYRGAGAHKHGTNTALAVQILNMLVGAFYVPGGHRGPNLVGPAYSWKPGATEEGLITPPSAIGHGARYYDFEDRVPEELGLNELFPISTNRSPMYQMNMSAPGEFGLTYKPELLIVCRRNLMMNNTNPEAIAEMLKKIPYIVSFATHVDETAEFADLVLPETFYLERFDLFPNRPSHTMSQATGHFYWGVRQPVVEPQGQARRWIDVMLELADRLGFLGDVYKLFNVKWGLKDPYKLDPGRRYTMNELYDSWTKSLFGPERGIEWFKTHGYHKLRRTPDENYPGPFIKARFPIYFENMLRAKDSVSKVAAKLGKQWDTSDYKAVPEWKPCPAYEQNQPPYDLYVVNFKIPFHALSVTTENPWLGELSERNPYAYKILINTETAARKGVSDGDQIWVESEAGRVKGEAKVTECIHPEVIGIAGVFGSWAEGKPVAKGKGVHFNTLLPLNMSRIDPISSGVDSCIRVKVSRAA
jgi:molybdopterin-containing oxidoreductase family molybdopterin binding subunit